MPVQVASNLIPRNGAKWHVVEDVYVKGGLRVVANAAARDAIYADSTARLGLKTGMLLTTADDGKLWRYVGSGQWVRYKTTASSTHVQETPASEWIFNHNQGSRFFTYTVFDADGQQVFPDQCHILDSDNLKLSFAIPIAGHATFLFDV